MKSSKDAIRGPAGACDLDELRAALIAGRATVAGVLSGTSADGIDVVLARFPGGGAKPQTEAFETLPFPADLGSRVRAALDGAEISLGACAELNRDLGAAFGIAAKSVAQNCGLPLDLIGSHGQTVYHHDGRGSPATMQLGDGDFVAAASGAFVASDFRQADIAAGGEGAPIAALVDGDLFEFTAQPLWILNLGGMANLTHLYGRDEVQVPGSQTPKFETEAPFAWDTGPCGSLLDGLARRLFDQPFDSSGALAARGQVQAELLEGWLSHPFFAQSPPKSTGRDTFGEAWIDELVQGSGHVPGKATGQVSGCDLLRTAVACVAESVARDIRRAESSGPKALPKGRLLLCGGGIHNQTLRLELEKACARRAESTDSCGVDPDAREALAFAMLARRCALGQPSTRPGATGAKPGSVLGKLSHPPRT